MAQLELFAQPAAAVSTVPSQAFVRDRIQSVLNLLRSAQALPWSEKEAARLRLTVPQMADWLPAEERDAVRAEFAGLLARLEG